MSGLIHDVPEWYEEEYDGAKSLDVSEGAIWELVGQRKNLELEEKMLAERIKELQEKKRIRSKQIEWLTDGILFRMDSLGRTKLKNAEYTVSLRNNPDRVEVDDVESLPKEFQRVKVEADKKALAEYSKAHELPPGCKWVSGGQSVVIR